MYNTYAEVDLLVDALTKIAASDGRNSRSGPIGYLR
jgi:hypothetical protein